MRRAALPLLSMVIALLAFAALSALVVTRLGLMDGADAALVVAVHTARVVSLVVVAPFVARLVAASG